MSQENVPAVPVALRGAHRRGEWPARGRYWKSLDELAATPAFLDYLHREFPEQASVFEDTKGRREFLTLMGASLALAGLTACTKQPEERILPYVRQPEGLVPGGRSSSPRPTAPTATRAASSSRATRGARPRSRATPTTR